MVYIYNTKTEDHTMHPNNIPIYRGTLFGNPYTFDGKRSNLARLSFRTRQEAISAYAIYFNEMLKHNDMFKRAFDMLYEKYKNGEDIYLQCFCHPEPCHGEIIKNALQQRLVREQMKLRKQEKK